MKDINNLDNLMYYLHNTSATMLHTIVKMQSAKDVWVFWLEMNVIN